MAENLENSNPTVLLPSDLPSRKQPTESSSLLKRRRDDGGTGLFDTTSTTPSFMYAAFDSASDASVSEDDDEDVDVPEDIDEQEIYGKCFSVSEKNTNPKTFTNTWPTDLISQISDPEHPLSLGSLAVVNLPDIHMSQPNPKSQIRAVLVELTPTVNHCSLATVIGLGVRVRLEQSLNPRYRVEVRIKEGTHSTAAAVNKQLADKERVAAAMENNTLVGVIRRMLVTCWWIMTEMALEWKGSYKIKQTLDTIRQAMM
jgi:metal-sulfur cluster biosynthetic enzyme